MIILKIIGFSLIALLVLIWVGARMQFYISPQQKSFNQYVTFHFSTKWNFVNIADWAIKLLAFSALIYQLWQRF